MKISKEQLFELWKIRLFYLGSRKPKWILDNIWFPLVFMIFPWALSGFNKDYMIRYLIRYMVVVLIASIIYTGLHLTKKHLIYKDYPIQLSTLLYIAFDLVMLSWFTLALIDVGILELKIFTDLTITVFITARILFFVFFLCLFIFLAFLSPLLLRWKITWALKQKHISSNQRIAFITIGAAPGAGIIIASLFRLTGNTNTGGLLATTYTFFISTALMVFIIPQMYELYLLLTNKWPGIRKSDSGYIVTDK